MSRIFLLIGAFALFAAACSGEAAVTTTTTIATTTTVAPTTTSTTSTTTPPPTTTTTIDESTTVTTIPAGFASPINGLPPARDSLLDRRAIGIKIPDELNARPQSGVLDADMVIEMRMAADKVRWIAVFHDNDSDYVGNIRSLRPTDSTLMAALGAPLAVSGGQSWIQQLHRSRDVGLIKIDTGQSEAKLEETLEARGGEMGVVGNSCSTCAFRTSNRSAPHNLYTTTDLVRRGADAMGISDDPPGPLYPIVQWTIPETTANQIVLTWSNTLTIRWEWTGDQYVRSWLTASGYHAQEVVDRDGSTEQIAVDVLVILDGEFSLLFGPPPVPVRDAVPVTETTGSGNAWVFARGAVWEGTWQRASYSDPFTLLNPDGTETGVPPGFSWVSIFPNHRTVTWE